MRELSVFKLTIVLALILGVFFRFFAPDKKGYWFDEVFTSLRVSGLPTARS